MLLTRNKVLNRLLDLSFIITKKVYSTYSFNDLHTPLPGTTAHVTACTLRQLIALPLQLACQVGTYIYVSAGKRSQHQIFNFTFLYNKNSYFFLKNALFYPYKGRLICQSFILCSQNWLTAGVLKKCFKPNLK